MSPSPLTERCLEKVGNALIGRTDMKDALNKLDKLTQEEARMAGAQNLKATDAVDERVKGVANTVKRIADDVDKAKRSSSNFIDIEYGASHIISEQAEKEKKEKEEKELRESIHKWLSAPDPSTNHKTACDIHHKKTATWFFQGNIFREWKSRASLLWIHGKRVFSPVSHRIPPDAILKDSWLWQEYSLVSRCLALSIKSD